jgi:hypothetical protein
VRAHSKNKYGETSPRNALRSDLLCRRLYVLAQLFRELFQPMFVPNVRGFVTEPCVAFCDSGRKPFAPFKKFRIPGLDAHMLHPSFGTRPEDKNNAANQIIDRIEFNDSAKNHVADRFQSPAKIEKAALNFRTHSLDVRELCVFTQLTD